MIQHGNKNLITSRFVLCSQLRSVAININNSLRLFLLQERKLFLSMKRCYAHRREAQGCGGQDSGDGRHGRKDGGLFGVLALDGFLGLGRASYGILQQFQRVGGLCSRNGFPRGTNAVWRGLVVGKNVC